MGNNKRYLMFKATIASTLAVAYQAIQIQEFLPENVIEWVTVDTLAAFDAAMVAEFTSVQGDLGAADETLATARGVWDSALTAHSTEVASHVDGFMTFLLTRAMPSAELRTNLDTEFPDTNQGGEPE